MIASTANALLRLSKHVWAPVAPAAPVAQFDELETMRIETEPVVNKRSCENSWETLALMKSRMDAGVSDAGVADWLNRSRRGATQGWMLAQAH